MGSPTCVTWDWSLHVPVLVSNYVFSTLVPEDTTDYCKDRAKHVASQYNIHDYNVQVLGGVSGGINFPAVCQASDGSVIHDDDVKVILVHHSAIVKNTDRTNSSDDQRNTADGSNEAYLAEIEETSAGYLRLRLFDPESIHTSLRFKDSSGNFYLRADIFNTGLPNLTTGDITPYPKANIQHVQNRNVSSPTWTHTAAVRCTTWPTVGKDWTVRQRKHGLPSQQLIETVEREGCLVVPSTHTGQEGIWWQYNFDKADRRMLTSLTPLQKQVLIIVKVLATQAFGSPRVLEPHHFTSLYLSLLECVPSSMWKRDQLTQLTMFVIDSLLHTLISRTLPHHISGFDLLSGLSCDFLDQTQATVADLRTGALRAIMNFSQKFVFHDAPVVDKEVYESITAVIQGDFTPQSNSDSILKALVPFLVRYTRHYYLKDGSRTSATDNDQSVADKLQTLSIHQSTEAPEMSESKTNDLLPLHTLHNTIKASLSEIGAPGPSDVVWYTILAEYSHDTWWQLKLQEFIVNNVELQTPTSFRGNLACMYHTMMCKGHSQYREKAADMFMSCYSSNCSPATRADYAVFLCNTQQWEKAHEVLSSIIDQEPTPSANGYSNEELITLDRELQKLGGVLPLNSVPSRSLAFYFMVITLQNLNKQTDEVLNQFSSWCKESVKDSISTIMLNLSLQRCEKFGQSAELFHRELAQNEDTLAKCSALLFPHSTDTDASPELMQWLKLQSESLDLSSLKDKTS